MSDKCNHLDSEIRGDCRFGFVYCLHCKKEISIDKYFRACFDEIKRLLEEARGVQK